MDIETVNHVLAMNDFKAFLEKADVYKVNVK